MSRPRPAPVPTPEPTAVAAALRLVTLLTVEQLAAALQVSRWKIDNDIPAGLPHHDLSTHHPLRRKKRCLRFNLEEVLQWYRERSR